MRARSRLRSLVKIKHNVWKTVDVIGCSFNELKDHLESKFTDGMTWDMLMAGKIHIDHIVPICLFDFDDINQLKVAFNWRNTQPLWKKDNAHKSFNLPPNFYTFFPWLVRSVLGDAEVANNFIVAKTAKIGKV